MAGTQRETTLRFMTEPADVNFGGKVHGGVVMKWIDQAGYACAVGWSGSYCVTVYVGSIRFERPIMIGQMVEVRARLIMTGTTSMHLSVEVAAQDLLSGERFEATRCVIVFVAVDSQGKPTKVPPWVPLGDEDKLLADYAAKLMRLREGIEERLQTGAAKP